MPDNILFNARQLVELDDYNRLGSLTINKLEEYVLKHVPWLFRRESETIPPGPTWALNNDTTNQEGKWPIVLSGLDYAFNLIPRVVNIYFDGIALTTNGRILKGLNYSNETKGEAIGLSEGGNYLIYIYLIDKNIYENRYIIDPQSPSTPPTQQNINVYSEIKWKAEKKTGLSSLNIGDVVGYFLDDNNFPNQHYRIPICAFSYDNINNTISNEINLIPYLTKDYILNDGDEFVGSNLDDDARDSIIYRTYLSFRKFIKALLENIQEIKGTSRWYHKPATNIANLDSKTTNMDGRLTNLEPKVSNDHISSTDPTKNGRHWGDLSIVDVFRGYISKLEIDWVAENQFAIRAPMVLEINGKMIRITEDILYTIFPPPNGRTILYIFAKYENNGNISIFADSFPPNLNKELGGWYHQTIPDTRCIGAMLTVPGSGDSWRIAPFRTNGNFTEVMSDSGAPTVNTLNNWTTIDMSNHLPVFAKKAYIKVYINGQVTGAPYTSVGIYFRKTDSSDEASPYFFNLMVGSGSIVYQQNQNIEISNFANTFVVLNEDRKFDCFLWAIQGGVNNISVSFWSHGWIANL